MPDWNWGLCIWFKVKKKLHQVHVAMANSPDMKMKGLQIDNKLEETLHTATSQQCFELYANTDNKPYVSLTEPTWQQTPSL